MGLQKEISKHGAFVYVIEMVTSPDGEWPYDAQAFQGNWCKPHWD